MLKGHFSNLSPLGHFIVAGLVITVCAVVISLLSILMILPFGGSFSMDFMAPENLNFLKFMQITQSIGIFIIPSILIGWLIFNQPFESLQITAKPTFQLVWIGIGIILMTQPFVIVLTQINSMIQMPESLHFVETYMKEKEVEAFNVLSLFVSVKTIPAIIVNLFMIAIIPALGEELLFRGVLQNIFSRWFKNEHLGIWIAAFIFSAIHFQFYGFFARMFLGGVMGYLLFFTRNLWIPIIAHLANNLLGFILYSTGVEKLTANTPENQINETISPFYTLISIGIMILLFYQLKNLTEQKNSTSSNLQEE